MASTYLTALPVYNERQHVGGVLDETLRYSPDVLVVDDGSTDGTAKLLQQRSDIQVVTHSENRGYGAALKSAFEYALAHGYDVLVTIDCDGQHQPRQIPEMVAACQQADIVSGSRYLAPLPGNSKPPEERRYVNRVITAQINRRLDLDLTDGFCGFKAYRVEALRKIELTETGYAMPIQLWVEAVAADLKIVEVAVPLIYLEEERSFGGALDDVATRLAIYRDVLRQSLLRRNLNTSAPVLGPPAEPAQPLDAGEMPPAESACGETGR